MVLLLRRLGLPHKLSSKLDNHHQTPPPEALSASLQAFRSDVSNRLHQLLGNPAPELEFMSLKWIKKCFELLPVINRAFAKMVVDIDYPMSEWEVGAAEEYLSYSLNLLELLNSVTSSISHLDQARLSLSHALSLIETTPSLMTKRATKIRSANSSKDFKVGKVGVNEKRPWSGKEYVIHEALLLIKSTGFWVFGIVLSGLSGDVRPYMEMRKFIDLTSMALEASLFIEMKNKGCVIKEVKEIDDAVASIADGRGGDAAAEELKSRLAVLDQVLQGVGEEADDLFSKILAGRNELLDSLRRKSISNI
ncbi:hypothetical protein RJ639_006391 [Escallonia herrerae]|uniref:Uncharacterized protein n=1 Tax=Escallonia herrerae TaxID=1293975 RepID=A0AA88VZY2_9ASTE|nr:hypothetical protein RJ639_006391 [Escallonia herrerae]